MSDGPDLRNGWQFRGLERSEDLGPIWKIPMASQALFFVYWKPCLSIESGSITPDIRGHGTLFCGIGFFGLLGVNFGAKL